LTIRPRRRSCRPGRTAWGDGDGPAQVDREHPIPHRLVGAGEEPELVVARVVDEHLERTEIALGGRDGGGDRGGRAHVELVGGAVEVPGYGLGGTGV